MSFLVLPLDDDLVARVTQTAGARGWTLDVSRGSEQVIVCVAEGGNPSELLTTQADREAVDVIELQTREVYARRRARRRLHNALVASLGLLTLVGWIVPIFGFLRPPLASFQASGLVPVASVDGITPGSARRVWVGDRQLLLVHRDEGHFHAFDARCTFMSDCLLEWDAAQERVVCPFHGCVFDLYGNIVAGPPWAPLASFAVERIGDRLYIGGRE